MSQSQLNINNSSWGRLTSSVSISLLNHIFLLSPSLAGLSPVELFVYDSNSVPSLLLLSLSDAGADMNFTICLKMPLKHVGKRLPNAVVSSSVS